MRSTTAILTVKLLGDNQTSKAFREAQSSAQKFEAGLDKAAGVATGVLGGMAAAGFGAALAAEAVASANAVVANVLGNMGMGKATDRVLEYADGLEKSLGIDEKVIKTTQGKLATFSELASSADVAGGAFDRATMAALDMAAAGFGTAEGNAVQLGKALQDPIKGITALQKSGITFTEEQKKMIEAMVEAGDVAGAQDLILGELEKQVGGTAEANADGSAKMQLAFGEVAETVGTALLPILDALLPKVQEFADWASQNTGTIMKVGAVVGGLATAVLTLRAAMAVWNTVAAVSGALAKAWGSNLGMALRLTIAQSAAIVKDTAVKLANNAATAAKNALTLVGKGITLAAAAAQGVLNAVMAMNPIMLVVIAIVALVAILVIAYQKSETFRNIVNQVGNVLKGIFMGAVNGVKTAISSAWNVMRSVGSFLSGAFTAAWNGLKAGIDKVKQAFNTVRDAVKGVWDWFKNLISKAGELLDKLNPFKALGNLFGGGGKAGRTVVMAGAGRAGAAPTVVNYRAVGYNPQRDAVALARMLGGATIRTGFRGVRAA